MKSRKVGLYDHDCHHPTSRPSVFLEMAKEVAQGLGDEVLLFPDEGSTDDEVAVIEGLVNCSPQLYVVHVRDEAWKKLIDEAAPGAVCLRSSSVGLEGQCFKSDRGVSCFNLRPKHAELSPSDWKLVVETTRSLECLEQLARGDAPQPLSRMFGERTADEVIPALLILCQGYLCVWAEARKEERVTGSVPDIALGRIGWDGLSRDVVGSDFGIRWDEVTDASYWNVFDVWNGSEFSQQGWDTCVRQLRRELELAPPLDGGDELESIPRSMRALIEVIKAGRPVKDGACCWDDQRMFDQSVMTVTSLKSIAWQRRRSAFNHDWLKNEYLPALAKWKRIVDGDVEDDRFESRFCTDVLPEWESRALELARIVGDYEEHVSPRTLFEVNPLKQCFGETHTWLQELVHVLWCMRCGVGAQVAAVRCHLELADAAFSAVRVELESEIVEVCPC